MQRGNQPRNHREKLNMHSVLEDLNGHLNHLTDYGHGEAERDGREEPVMRAPTSDPSPEDRAEKPEEAKQRAFASFGAGKKAGISG